MTQGKKLMCRINCLYGNSDNKIEKDFLLPLLLNKKRLKEMGLDVRFFSKLDGSLIECDILCIVSSYYRLYQSNPKIMDLLKEKMVKASRCYLFETTDSTGAFANQLIPIVDRYYKKQLLRDRKLYLSDLYNKRIVFDYYHRQFNLTEEYSTVYENKISEGDLAKFRLSWNVGLGDYCTYPRIIRRFIRSSVYSFMDPTKRLDYKDAITKRDVDILNCYGSYVKDCSSSIISFHRKTTSDIVNKLSGSYKVFTDSLHRSEYYRVLRNSKLSICPLGWGEMTWKVFESFIRGVSVVMPNMDFMETWPNYFHAGETYQPYNWDFSDLEEKCIELLENKERRDYIASKGQSVYMNSISDEGKKEFCTYFKEIIT